MFWKRKKNNNKDWKDRISKTVTEKKGVQNEQRVMVLGMWWILGMPSRFVMILIVATCQDFNHDNHMPKKKEKHN